MHSTVRYRGYVIVIKRDWGTYGWWCSTQRRLRRRGVVVTDGTCNVIPGAGWFESVRHACIGIDALVNVGLGYDVMEPLSLDERIERESARAPAWHDEFARLMRVGQAPKLADVLAD